MKTLINFTDNTQEALRNMQKGQPYLVKYKNIEGKKSLTVAVWDGKDFDYCKSRFWVKQSPPVLKFDAKDPTRRGVVAWFMLEDYSEEVENG